MNISVVFSCLDLALFLRNVPLFSHYYTIFLFLHAGTVQQKFLQLTRPRQENETLLHNFRGSA